MSRSPARPIRPAYTLVELLVVIAIIAILASLLAGGIFLAIGRQQDSLTVVTFQKVNGVLNKQWQGVVAGAKKESPSDAVKAMAAPDPTGERARILWIKCRLMETFPVSFAEIGASPLYSGVTPLIPVGQRRSLAGYQKQLAKRTGTTNPETESAACLLMALSTARGGASLTADELGASTVQDIDGDGLKEIVDAYNNPLRFYRFAWTKPNFVPDLQAANPGGIQQRNADPLDTRGLFFDWAGGLNRMNFESVFHRIEFPAPQPPPPTARYVIPVLASAGRDGQWGLVPPTQCAQYGMSVFCTPANDPNSVTPDPAQLPYIGDNVYSFNQRLQ